MTFSFTVRMAPALPWRANVSRRHQMVDGMIIQKEIVCDNAPMAAARDQTPNPFQAEVDLERKEPNYYRGLL